MARQWAVARLWLASPCWLVTFGLSPSHFVPTERLARPDKPQPIGRSCRWPLLMSMRKNEAAQLLHARYQLRDSSQKCCRARALAWARAERPQRPNGAARERRGGCPGRPQRPLGAPAANLDAFVGASLALMGPLRQAISGAHLGYYW